MSDTDVTEYDWDHRNRLTTITERATGSGPPTKVVSYEYDVFNRRLAKSIDSDGDGTVDSQQFFVFDGERADRDNAGDHISLQFDDPDGDGPQVAALSHRYLHGPAVDQILADEDVATGDVLWPLTDNLGNVRDLAVYDDVAATTAVVNHITYDAYGSVTSETDAAIEHLYGFTGRERDEESDLQFNRARYYDTALGQWLNEDAIGFDAGDPNIRRYVGNNATSATDPSGLETKQPFNPDGVELQLAIKDPEVYRWWKHLDETTNPTPGTIDAEWTTGLALMRRNVVANFSEDHSPTIRLNMYMSEEEAAAAIIREARNGRLSNDNKATRFANDYSRGFHAFQDKHLIGVQERLGGDSYGAGLSDLLRQRQQHGYSRAALWSLTLAELYVNGVFSFNEGADVAIVTAEIVSGKVNWGTAFAALPFIPSVARKAGGVEIVDAVAGRVLEVIPQRSIDSFKRLPQADQDRLIRQMNAAQSPADAARVFLAGTEGVAERSVRQALTIIDSRIKCFTRDTLVATTSGLRPIGEIEAGETVYAFDFAAGDWVPAKVSERHDNIYEGPVITVDCSDCRIETTINHPFWVIDGSDLEQRNAPRSLSPNEDQGKALPGRWVNSHELREGDVILGQDGVRRRVAGIAERYESAIPVSNLTVEEHHTFAVGTACILVHNTGFCDLHDAVVKANPGKTPEQINEIVHGVLAGKASGIRKYVFADKRFKTWTGLIDEVHGTDALGRTLDDARSVAKSEKWKRMHGHHIVRKGQDSAVVLESQKILRDYDIDPFLGKENLVYAPNKGHTDAYDELVRDKLKAVVDKGKRRGWSDDRMKSQLTSELQELAQKFIEDNRG